jgi:hypothetical protein
MIKAHRETEMPVCDKRPFWSHVHIKTIILPRQVRDKHRKSGEKEVYAFLAAGVRV